MARNLARNRAITWFYSVGMMSLLARIQNAQRESQGDWWVRPEKPVVRNFKGAGKVGRWL